MQEIHIIAPTLLAEVERLSTFAAAADWDTRAEAEVRNISQAIEAIDVESRRLQTEIERLEGERKGKGFFARAVSGKGDQTKLHAEIVAFADQRDQLEDLAAKLLEAVDRTPASAAEQKALIKDLRLQKKELAADKREIGAAMQATRTQARVASAASQHGLAQVLGMGPAERRRMRWQKEMALKPQESAKAGLDRQILAIDRMIMWAERFKE